MICICNRIVQFSTLLHLSVFFHISKDIFGFRVRLITNVPVSAKVKLQTILASHLLLCLSHSGSSLHRAYLSIAVKTALLLFIGHSIQLVRHYNLISINYISSHFQRSEDYILFNSDLGAVTYFFFSSSLSVYHQSCACCKNVGPLLCVFAE